MPKKIQNDLGPKGNCVQMFSFKHSLNDNTHSKHILSSPLEKTKREKKVEISKENHKYLFKFIVMVNFYKLVHQLG